MEKVRNPEIWNTIVVCIQPEFINFFSCSSHLNIQFILLINVKMPFKIVVILTLISRINATAESFKVKILYFSLFYSF